ncbi:MAG: sensor histidine kinase [Blastocatellia bacterium]|jgi:heavy metal sensor kinase
MDCSVMASLRFKLTFYYLAILSLVLVGFGIVLYAYLSRTLMTTIDASLAAQIEQIERRVAFAAGGEAASVGGGTGDLLLQLSPQVTQILDEQGRIVDEVMVLTGDQLIADPAELQARPLGETRFMTLQTERGEPLRVATRRVRDPEGEPGTYFIRLGQSLRSLEEARRRLLVGLGLTIPLVLLMGSFGGLILARQALRPVDRMTKIADRIGGGDLTERVPVPAYQDEIGRLAVTINQMIARLQAAFERQRQFSADASHELRTPLSVIRADLEIALRRERTIPEYQEVLASTLEEAVRLSRLVEDLLLLTRADVGRLELECQPVNVTTLGREVVDYLQPLAAQRQQTLTWASEAPRDLVLPADPLRLRQMLINLIDNAVKFTGEGGEIALTLTEESGNALLRVRDTGRGIPPEDLPLIFDRFFRRSAMTGDRSTPGTGLGLSIVRWIVEAHGGTIGVTSRLGEGTEFQLRLPLADPTQPIQERRR